MSIRYVPGMPWKLDPEGNRVPDLDAIRACPFVTPYTHSQFHPRPRLKCDPDSSLTQQEFTDECDINIIMRRYAQTGRLPGPLLPPQYGDFGDMGDYFESLQFIQQAQEDFLTLPSTIRERFNNDPGALLQFLHDPRNREEAVTLGLVAAAAPPGASAPATNDNNASTTPTNQPGA